MIVVLRTADKTAQALAKKAHCPVVVSDSWELPGERVLFAGPGATIPWAMVPAAEGFLAHWDAAVPLWRYGVLAEDLGTPAERERTRGITRDLRIPVYAPELLFVAGSDAGRELVATWRAECEHGRDERLAFIRAHYLVKPRLCVLPRNWLAETGAPLRPQHTGAPTRRERAPLPEGVRKVEIAPGRWVRCKAGEEDDVKRVWAERLKKRHEE